MKTLLTEADRARADLIGEVRIGGGLRTVGSEKGAYRPAIRGLPALCVQIVTTDCPEVSDLRVSADQARVHAQQAHSEASIAVYFSSSECRGGG